MGNFSKFCANAENLAVVVAFDPGEHIGWCALGVEPKTLTNGLWTEPMPLHRSLVLAEYGEFNSNRIGPDSWAATVKRHAGLNLSGENEAVQKMLGLMNNWPRAAIVFEDFILDFTKADQARHTLSPIRITSSFAYGRFAQGWGVEQIFVQNRSMAKTTCTDLRLKNWGLYDERSGKHARDACRHAYYFLRDCYGSELNAQEKRHMAWPHLFADPMKVKDDIDDMKKAMANRKPKQQGERVEVRD